MSEDLGLYSAGDGSCREFLALPSVHFRELHYA
jgi:hypothetical protein